VSTISAMLFTWFIFLKLLQHNVLSKKAGSSTKLNDY
jgi:hypothetical protein